MSSVPQSPPAVIPAVIPDHRRHFADNLRETALLFFLMAIPAIVFTSWAAPAAIHGIEQARIHAAYRAAHPPPAPEPAFTADGYRVIERADSSWGRKLECARCDGDGMVTVKTWSMGRPSGYVTPCPRCRGRGWIYEAELYPHY